jgi:hypothetical protein
MELSLQHQTAGSLKLIRPNDQPLLPGVCDVENTQSGAGMNRIRKFKSLYLRFPCFAKF